MPFAAIPSSGFVPPQAPSWAPFAAQANEFIQKGGEMRAAAGKDFADSIQKAAAQITGILEEASPEGRLKKALKLEALKAQKGLYDEYQSMTPEQRQQTFEFKNGMLQYRDRYTGLMKAIQFKNALKRGVLLDASISGKAPDPYNEHLRQQAGLPPTQRTPDTSGFGNASTDITVGDTEDDSLDSGDAADSGSD